MWEERVNRAILSRWIKRAQKKGGGGGSCFPTHRNLSTGGIVMSQTADVKAILGRSPAVKMDFLQPWSASIQLRCRSDRIEQGKNKKRTWDGGVGVGGDGRVSNAIDLAGSRRGQLPIHLGSPYHLSASSPASVPAFLPFYFLRLRSRLTLTLTFPDIPSKSIIFFSVIPLFYLLAPFVWSVTTFVHHRFRGMYIIFFSQVMPVFFLCIT